MYTKVLSVKKTGKIRNKSWIKKDWIWAFQMAERNPEKDDKGLSVARFIGDKLIQQIRKWTPVVAFSVNADEDATQKLDQAEVQLLRLMNTRGFKTKQRIFHALYGFVLEAQQNFKQHQSSGDIILWQKYGWLCFGIRVEGHSGEDLVERIQEKVNTPPDLDSDEAELNLGCGHRVFFTQCERNNCKSFLIPYANGYFIMIIPKTDLMMPRELR